MPTISLSNRASLVGPHEYYILKFLVKSSDSYELIPKQKIQEEVEVNPSQLDFYISKLLKLKLIYQEKVLGENSFKITFAGLDVISIKKLYEMKVLKRLSTVIGEGKESTVFLGHDFDDNLIAVKFHRIGKNSYKTLRRKKRTPYGRKSWIRLTIENAEAEYNAISCLWKNNAKVPRPRGIGINAVAMDYIEGGLLYNTKVDDPEKVLSEILSSVKIAFSCCNLVHNDLSPYNILIKDDTPYLIDWPQASPPKGENLENDIMHILDFFKKRYNIDKDPYEIISYIRD